MKDDDDMTEMGEILNIVIFEDEKPYPPIYTCFVWI